MLVTSPLEEIKEKTPAQQREAAAMLHRWLEEGSESYDKQVMAALEAENANEASYLRIGDESGD